MVDQIEKDAEATKRAEFISGLRAMADAFESRPNMPIPKYGLRMDIDLTVSEYTKLAGATEYTMVYDNEATLTSLKKATRAIPGKKNKEFKDYAFEVIKDFGGEVRYKIWASRKSVCKAVPTGNKIVHAAYLPAIVPERIEEEVEWICDDALVMSK